MKSISSLSFLINVIFIQQNCELSATSPLLFKYTCITCFFAKVWRSHKNRVVYFTYIYLEEGCHLIKILRFLFVFYYKLLFFFLNLGNCIKEFITLKQKRVRWQRPFDGKMYFFFLQTRIFYYYYMLLS